MKTFFLSILAAISSFLGINRSEPITSTTTLISPEITQTETSPAPSIIETITLMPTQPVKPKPTVYIKPVSVVDEDILKTKFGINNQDLIKEILNDNSKLENYEREYYNQLKGWPELETNAPEQRIFIPSLNSTKICKTAHITEIKNASINVDNIKTKTYEHLKQFSLSDLVRPVLANDLAETIDEEIEKYTQDLNAAKDALNEIIKKYCNPS